MEFKAFKAKDTGFLSFMFLLVALNANIFVTVTAINGRIFGKD